jgi:hypothetical protein
MLTCLSKAWPMVCAHREEVLLTFCISRNPKTLEVELSPREKPECQQQAVVSLVRLPAAA